MDQYYQVKNYGIVVWLRGFRLTLNKDSIWLLGWSGNSLLSRVLHFLRGTWVFPKRKPWCLEHLQVLLVYCLAGWSWENRNNHIVWPRWHKHFWHKSDILHLRSSTYKKFESDVFFSKKRLPLQSLKAANFHSLSA